MSERHKITLSSEQYGATYSVTLDSGKPITLPELLEWLDHYAVQGIGFTSHNQEATHDR